MSKSVKVLLLLVLMLVSCVAIVVAGYLSYQKEQVAFMEAVICEGKASADQMATEITTRLDHYAVLVSDLGQQSDIAAWAEGQSDDSALRAAFDAMLTEEEGIDRMTVVGLDQRVFDTRPPIDFFEELAASHQASEETLQQIQALLSGNPDTFYVESVITSQGDWYNQVIATRELFYSEPYFNQDDQPALTIAAPVMDGDTLVGVGALQVLLRSGIFPSIRDFTFDVRYSTGYCWVMDCEGVVISHPAADKELNYSLRNHPNADLAQAVEDMIAGKGIEEAQSSQYTYEGIDKFLFWRVIPETGWGVVTTTPVAEMMGEAESAGLVTIIKTLLLEVVAVVLFVIAIAFVATRKPKK